ncbi:MAG: glucuronosyltransferase [Alphaproteobacteria bacterium]|nr:glucuronosyltransferase [Alphaproteobacteria bacterium]
MSTVVFVSAHYLKSKRNAGFHWLADAFELRGWNVVFLCVGFSRLSRLGGVQRLEEVPEQELNQLHIVRGHVTSFVWYPWWHPMNLHNRALNRLMRPVYRRFGRNNINKLSPLIPYITGADLFVFEGGPGLLLFDYFKEKNGSARYTYRVSDDVRVVPFHPIIGDQEDRIATDFDLISVPSARMLGKFARCRNVVHLPHGLNTRPFDVSRDSPYRDRGKVNAVSIGSTLFDADFFDIAAELFPEIDFHVIGYSRELPDRRNLFRYGEMPFKEMVPYVKFADIGVAAYTYREGAEYLADSSNKIAQYTYCRLPLVAPDFLKAEDRGNLFSYRPGDPASIRQAMRLALGFDASTISWPNFVGWDDHVDLLTGVQGHGSTSEHPTLER